MKDFKPSAGFVRSVMRRIAESEEQAVNWETVFQAKLLRFTVAASALLGSALIAIPCH
jgi:hypothetical protein